MARTAEVVRNTKETQISVSVDLDGSSVSDVQTGIGFFDHMLDSFARHGGIDLTVRTEGDLHIDFHHTVEDTGIVIGQAINKALDGFKGVRRFGHAYIPMDETLTRCAIDLSNRPYLIWNVAFKTPKIGEFDTELFKEFHHAFAMNLGACVHLETLYGDNSHHIAESGFKALARALRTAVELDPKTHGHAPSTKGVL
ncbi:MAG: imidazoleglycerol-phosphate dehydratase HisB [Phenylobacterium sp.]|uniref:imidazoleglycerol-phosphate dehydratase HisB n=1 Tax=Phenylobacterium sp. TaxID=1871053 RepID=UPI001B52D819|nr:imidazoleglycerol-phosphate dehydratase HisB [Phenylobacterium sp.]MBP7650319.1 imidazoleglycerol-phosphate dehydratase HisB [Phenylobacterium sp.]MBP7817368.1 imidazoleglycerol-phosphate dehydratase HisB [Phenylobacterium sp.]MBP9231347.1 imidazoleglycerol-phosphate dehydratase HisB [Phenylobacterium sp.]MBP9756074.1 imidazoleglycerol-phosphate dehydratase HisB [Phenylobacterium sp.]